MQFSPTLACCCVVVLRSISASCTYFRQYLTTVPVESAEGEMKVCGRTGYRTRDLWLLSQTRYRLRHEARLSTDTPLIQCVTISSASFRRITVLDNYNNQLLQLCTARIAWSESDQAVRTMHSYNSW